jgi:hypothetical protein
MYIYNWNPLKLFEKGGEGEREWKCNGRGVLVQGTLYVCMELSQWDPLQWLMYANSKVK